MKKLIFSIPAPLFDIFVIEFNGYGIEILNRDESEVNFAIYVQDEEYEGIKEAINEIFEELGGGSLILEEEIKEENWEEKWKENFKPVSAPPFIIIPEWEVYEGKEYIPIKLKIGMAFGTGLHPTTQIALSLIPECVKEGKKVLDVGTGSGILAIASAKLGADVYAVDVQEEAVKECSENAWENEVSIKCEKKSVHQVEDRFDTVIANLQMDIFREHFDKIVQLFKDCLIITGIYGEKERDEITNMAHKHRLHVKKEIFKKDINKDGENWYGFIFEHQ